MSTIDLSRQATDFRKQYAGVRMQQGRVLTDDDFNEAARLEAEALRLTRLESIGPFGSRDSGFLPVNPGTFQGRMTFDLTAGSLELGGLRLELPQDEPFHQQKNWLSFQAPQHAPSPPSGGKGRVDLIWIEAWQQPVSAVEDRELFEVALGGADTTCRMRTMHRVRVMEDVGSGECGAVWRRVCLNWSPQGSLAEDMEYTPLSRLKVSFTEPSSGGSLCSPAQSGGYLGAENQAIRVQAVSASQFTWGLDNAAPLYRAVLMSDNGARIRLRLLTPPKDALHWPLKGQVVELLPWGAALANGERVAETTGHFSGVATSYDPDSQEFTIVQAPPAGFDTAWEQRGDRDEFYAPRVVNDLDQERFVYLRLWNRGDDLTSEPLLPLSAGTLGQTGLSISFQGTPRAGDFWIIAARPAAPEVVTPWSFSRGEGARPQGIRRYRAPLALLTWLPGGGARILDCRPSFRPLTSQTRCCVDLVATPGPGWERIFERIPEKGDAVICFPAGQYPLETTVVVANRGRLRLNGAGPASRIHGIGLNTLLLFKNCDAVDLRDLYCLGGNVAADGLFGTVCCEETRLVSLTRVALRCKGGRERRVACLRVMNPPGSHSARSCRVTIDRCDIYVGHLQTGLLLLNTNQVVLRHSRILPAGTTVERVGKALASRRFRDNLAQSALLLVKEGEPPLADGYRFKIKVRDGQVVQCWIDTAFRTYLKEAVESDKRIPGFRVTQDGQPGQEGFLRIHIMRRLRRVLGSTRARNANAALGEWLNAIDSAARAVIGQGVVVAGREAGQVIVESTVIKNAVQGVHVGVSHAGPNRTGKGADRAGRVIVRQNEIHTLLAAGGPLERHGIFVGNAASVTIADNHLSLERPAGLGHLPVDGIRVFGFLGEMVSIQGNHITGYSTSLRRAQRGREPQDAVRVERDNYHDGAILLLN